MDRKYISKYYDFLIPNKANQIAQKSKTITKFFQENEERIMFLGIHSSDINEDSKTIISIPGSISITNYILLSA